MNIRARCFSGILPVFAVLAVATGAFVYSLESSEAQWGLSEEAAGLVVTAAEFLDGERVAGGSCDAEFLAPLHRVLAFRRCQRFLGISLATGKPVFDVGPNSGGAVSLPEGLTDRLAQQPAEVAFLEDTAQGAIMRAHAPIRDGEGKVRGVLVVETDATALVAQRNASFRTVVKGVVVSLVAGLLCAWFVAMVLKRNVRALAVAAEAAAGGDYETAFDRPGSIHEIHDLWHTFRTAVSVLRGVGARARHELLGVERFRGEQDLAACYCGVRGGADAACAAGVRMDVRSLRSGQPDVIAAACEINTRLIGVMGFVVPQGTALKTAITMSAAVALLERRAAAVGLAEAVKTVVTLFPVRRLCCVEIRSGESEGTRVEYTETDGVQAFPVGIATGSVVFHTLEGAAAERLDLYLRNFSQDTHEDRVSNLLTIAQHCGNDGGSLMVVTPGV